MSSVPDSSPHASQSDDPVLADARAGYVLESAGSILDRYADDLEAVGASPTRVEVIRGLVFALSVVQHDQPRGVPDLSDARLAQMRTTASWLRRRAKSSRQNGAVRVLVSVGLAEQIAADLDEIADASERARWAAVPRRRASADWRHLLRVPSRA